MPVGRIEVQTRDVADFFDEQRVFGELEALDPVRLQGKRPPDAADHGLAQTTPAGHRASAPVRGIGRGALQGHSHYPLDLCITDLARRTGPRFVE